MPVDLSPHIAQDSARPWDDARVARLRELVAQGLSSSAIALKLDATRASVCAARSRYKVAPPAVPVPVRRAPRPAVAFPRAVARLFPVSPLPRPDPRDLKIVGVPLLELGVRDCRWPLLEPGDGVTRRFCGAPAAAGSSYCPRHRERSILRLEEDGAVLVDRNPAPRRPAPELRAPESVRGSILASAGAVGQGGSISAGMPRHAPEMAAGGD